MWGFLLLRTLTFPPMIWKSKGFLTFDPHPHDMKIKRIPCLTRDNSQLKLDKRAMMALNRSPESLSPKSEFYLLYYYCSNLWPPGWGQFWPQEYHMNRTDIGPNIIVQGQMIKALLLLVSEKKNFKVFFLCSYVSNLWPPGQGPIWPQGHHMNYLGTGPLGDATYEISKLCTF